MDKENPIYVVNPETTYRPSETVITDAILKALEKAINGVVGLTQWEFILEETDNNEEKPHRVVWVTSALGAGESCAKEKLQTLKNNPTISSTGELRDKTLPEGEVGWYGGISVPYGYANDMSCDDIDGVVRVIFSGAREVVDLGIVLEVLDTYSNARNRYLSGTMFCHYDDSGLRRDQMIAYLMDRMLIFI